MFVLFQKKATLYIAFSLISAKLAEHIRLVHHTVRVKKGKVKNNVRHFPERQEQEQKNDGQIQGKQNQMDWINQKKNQGHGQVQSLHEIMVYPTFHNDLVQQSSDNIGQAGSNTP